MSAPDESQEDVGNSMDAEAEGTPAEEGIEESADEDEVGSSSEDDESDDESDNDEEEEEGDDGDEVAAEDENEEDESEGEEDEEDDDEEEDGDDEDGEDDEEEDAEDEEEQEQELDGSDDLSGDENCERCPICLNRFRQQDVGTPESCDHNFCLECIHEWANNVNTCPVDRQVFRIILARHAGEEKIFKQLPVEDCQQEEEEEPEDHTYCEVCGHADREDRLLLCDGCDLGYHCDCLEPPLASVPVNEWFCPDCQQRRDAAAEGSQTHVHGRRIARTTVSERVRRTIAEQRAERAARRNRIAALIEAQETFEDDEEPTPGPSRSASTASSSTTRRKMTTTRKRKTTTKRKGTGRKKTTRKKTTKRKKTTTRKRKTKRKTTRRKTKTGAKGKRKKKRTRKGVKKTKKTSTSATSTPTLARTAISRAVTSVKGRIADRLGLSRPPAGRSIPMQKTPSGSARLEATTRSAVDYGRASFSILGSKDELYNFADQEGEERQPVHPPAIPAETLLSRSAKSSHKPLTFATNNKKVVKSMPAPTASSSGTGGAFDLLGSIMQNQDLLHKGSKYVVINRDGSISAKSDPSGMSKTTSGSSASSSSSLVPSTSSSTTGKPSPSGSGPPSNTKPSGTNLSPVKKLPSRNVSFGQTSQTAAAHTPVLPDNNSRDHANALDCNAAEARFNETASSDEELLAAAEMEEESTDVITECSDNVSVKKKASEDDDLTDKGASGGSERAGEHRDNSGDTQGFKHTKTQIKTECENSGVDNCDIFPNGFQYLSSIPTPNEANECSRDDTKGRSECSINLNQPVYSSSEHSSMEADTLMSNEGTSSTGNHARQSNGHDTGRAGELEGNVNTALEADMVYSNNARLNADEDVGNNSSGFGAAAAGSSQDLRNFAAVSRGLEDVVDDNHVGLMKRNFDLLVSTSANLAGYESGEDETGELRAYDHQQSDREEGEASDSGEEGELRDDEERLVEHGDEEEGEIVDDDEVWAVSARSCAADEHPEGMDVNAIHLEEMEIGTTRKRSMSHGEENNNDGMKKAKLDGEIEQSEEGKKVEEKEEEDDSEDDYDPEDRTNGSFMMANFLVSLQTNEFDKKKEKALKKEEARRRKEEEQKRHEEEQKRQEEEKEKEDISKHAISILDFIGNASAKKFGLATATGDNRGRNEQKNHRGSFSYDGGNSHRQRDHRMNGDRWRDGRHVRRKSGEEPEEEEMMHLGPQDRWRRSRYERQRSDSRDSRAVSQRSGSHDSRSSWSRQGSEMGKGKRRGHEESLDRHRRSRSKSSSPRRRGEKRRRSGDGEEDGRKDRQNRRRKKTRWSQREEVEEKEGSVGEEDENEEEESSTVSAGQSNGHLQTVEPNGQPQLPGHYPSQQYPQGATPYSHPYVTAAPPPPPRLNPAHPYPQPHTPHPGQPMYGHHPNAPPARHPSYPQPTQSQPVPGHPSHPGAPPHAYPAYYPQPQPTVGGPVRPTVSHPQSYHHPSYPHLVRHSVVPTSTPSLPSSHVPHSAPPHPQPRYPYPHAYPQRPRPPSGQHPLPGQTLAVPVGYNPTITSSAYQQQHPAAPHQPYPAATTSAAHRYPYPAAVVKQDTSSSSHPQPGARVEPGTSGQPPTVAASAYPESQPNKEYVRDGTSSEEKSHRASYRISPPTAPIKGVTTYDKVDSSILLNEVKKGFRQLVEDAVRCALKAAWSSRKITKDEYKDIFKRAVEKVCGSKETVVHQEKIQSLVDAYVIKARKARNT